MKKVLWAFKKLDYEQLSSSTEAFAGLDNRPVFWELFGLNPNNVALVVVQDPDMNHVFFFFEDG